jgi:alanyl-tRNA synthetase
VKIGDYSVELCGGTHVSNTSEIGLFKIIKEEGIGSGVRRITALTGQKAYESFKDSENILDEITEQVKAPQSSQALSKIMALQEELKENQKELESLNAKMAQAQSGEIFSDVKEIESLTYIATEVQVSDANGLRNLADIWKQKDVSDILVLVAKIEEKVSLLVASKSADKKAGDLVKELAGFIDGRGGGKPDMAMAGGSNPLGIKTLLENVPDKIKG